MRRRLWRGWWRRLLLGTGALGAAAVVLVAGVPGGYSAARPHLLSGSGWLASSSGVWLATDPHTLAPRGAPVSLASRLSPQGAALDDSGRLWVLDPATGDLVWIDRGQRHVRRGAGGDGALLSLAGGAPVIVNPNRRTAALLDPHDGSVRQTIDLAVRPGDQVQVSGSPHASRIYVVASRGVLEI